MFLNALPLEKNNLICCNALANTPFKSQKKYRYISSIAIQLKNIETLFSVSRSPCQGCSQAPAAGHKAEYTIKCSVIICSACTDNNYKLL